MFELAFTYLASSFLAGVLMFFAPCTLPLVPAFLAYVAGTSEPELAHGTHRKRLLVHTLAYCAGFSTVFIFLGLAAGYLGVWLSVYKQVMLQVGGVGLVVVGLYLLGVRIPWRASRSSTTRIRAVTSPGVAFGIGVVFAVGWTPCVGPLLATILLYASSQDTAVAGALLLAVFSLGLTVPFVATALGYQALHQRFATAATTARRIHQVAGYLLVFVGVIIATQTMPYVVEGLYYLFDLSGLSALYAFF